MLAKTQFKLGLFTLAALGALIATAFGLGWRRAHTATVRYVTYFDESVQGLDVGGAVKFRGVPIGNVSDIEVAPDRAHVEVGLAITRDEAQRLALDRIHLELRAELATQGVTGVRFVDLNYPGKSPSPPPVLAFPTSERYIPSRRSLLGGLSADVQATARDLPTLVERTTVTMRKLDRVLDEFRDEHVPARFGKLLDSMTAASDDARLAIADLRRARLPARAVTTLDHANDAIDKLHAAIAKLDGLDGLVASARRATDSLGRTSRERLDRTLEEVGEAARAFRELVDTLEREPDMLVKGRAKPRSR